MPDEPKPKQRKKQVEPEPEGVLATAAKAIGTAAGKMASLAGVAAPTPHTVSVKIPKLQKKDKSRLPRRQKKALQKAAAAKSGV
jgi:hypothetical protein